MENGKYFHYHFENKQVDQNFHSRNAVINCLMMTVVNFEHYFNLKKVKFDF